MYLFVTNGGYAICDAMEGVYDEEPARPHPYCDCLISCVDESDTLTTPTAGGRADALLEEAFLEAEIAAERRAEDLKNAGCDPCDPVS